jgi:hypothetical protein
VAQVVEVVVLLEVNLVVLVAQVVAVVEDPTELVVQEIVHQ